jgi:hypothetical protein
MIWVGMGRRVSIFVMAALALLFVSAPARAQGNPAPQPLYTYVTMWGVPRAQWGDMAKIDAAQKTAADPLVANGTLVGYGFFENRVHSEGGYTHGAWVQANSLANLFKALEPAYAQPDVTAPVLAASKHLDYLMVSTSYKAGAAANATGYLRIISAQVQPGRMGDFRNAYNRYLVPVYDRLMADGVIVGYQLDTEYNIENAPGRAFVVVTTRDPDGLDKIEAAYNSLFAQNPAVGQSLAALLVPNSRNDLLARVTSMTHK